MQTTTLSADDPRQAGSAVPPQDAAFLDALARYGPDLARFVTGYERDAPKRQELLQEVHLALWQSLAVFRGQCTLRTWVYRVAHNVGATHIERATRTAERDYVDLEAAELLPSDAAGIADADRRIDLVRILALIHRLKSPDREVMLLYLEDMDAASIGEVTGLSARNVATKVHRIKKLLSEQLQLQGNAQEAP
jgi:RNA polymerase sigma-70 factor, ECF subfamily